jgi:hypothetical protein
MKVTLENYEAFLLDALEGNLSPEDAADLRNFLAENPGLNEVEELELLHLVPSKNISFPDVKKLFFDEINEHNYHHFFIAYSEDQLSTKEKNAVLHWLSENPKYKREFENYKKCLLIPDRNIVYPNKKELYQNVSINKGLFYKLGIAAGFVGFLLLTSWLFLNNSSELSPKYVQLESEITKLKIEQQDSLIIPQVSNKINDLSPTENVKSNVTAKKILSESTMTGNALQQKGISSEAVNELNENNIVMNQLTALNTPMPFNEINLEYIDFSFYRADFLTPEFAENKSSNLISGLIQRGLTAYRKPKMLENIPEIPASIKSVPSRIQQSSLLAQDDVDVKIIRFRFMGITVEHTKVLEDKE